MTPSRIFVTGTDTDVGKTVVSAILVAGLGADYWKPIQSGSTTGGELVLGTGSSTSPNTDSTWVQSVTGCDSSRIHKERFALSRPLSPHAAAKIDGVEIHLEDFSLPMCDDRPLIVEGAGGVLVPLNEKNLMLNLIEKFALPVIIVARSGLGTINHTLLTLRALRLAGVNVLGVVMNGTINKSNCDAIQHYGQTQVIAQLEPLSHFSSATLVDAFSKFEWNP